MSWRHYDDDAAARSKTGHQVGQEPSLCLGSHRLGVGVFRALHGIVQYDQVGAQARHGATRADGEILTDI
jgi:hypothetical protein